MERFPSQSLMSQMPQSSAWWDSPAGFPFLRLTAHCWAHSGYCGTPGPCFGFPFWQLPLLLVTTCSSLAAVRPLSHLHSNTIFIFPRFFLFLLFVVSLSQVSSSCVILMPHLVSQQNFADCPRAPFLFWFHYQKKKKGKNQPRDIPRYLVILVPRNV